MNSNMHWRGENHGVHGGREGSVGCGQRAPLPKQDIPSLEGCPKGGVGSAVKRRTLLPALFVVYFLASLVAFSPSRAATNDMSLTELSVTEAVRVALARKPSLAAAAARVAQARARVVQAHSQYWPAIGAGASAARVDTADAAYRPELGIDDPETYYRAELKASWVLFDGFARKFSIALARLGAEEFEAAYAEARRQLALAVTKTFLSAQLAGEGIAIAEADAAFNARLLVERRAARALGAGSLADELNFEIRANAAESALIEARRDLAVARVGLVALMGAPDAFIPGAFVLAPLPAESPGELVEPRLGASLNEARANRPDRLRAKTAVERTGAAVGSARAAYWPSLALSAGVDGERAEDAGFDSDDFGSTAAVTLSYSFFDGGGRRGALSEAKAAAEEVEHLFHEVDLTVQRETREALVRLKSAQDQLRLQRRSTSLTEQNRVLVEKEYSAGQGSLTRLNEAQRDLVAAQVQLARARVALRTARAELDAAMGRVVNGGGD